MTESLHNATVPLLLDGRAYSLRFRVYAFLQYTERFKNDLMMDIKKIAKQCVAFERGDGDVNLADLLTVLVRILWAGLLDAHPDITEIELQRAIDVRDLQNVTGAILTALGMTAPPVKEGAAPAETETNGVNPIVAAMTLTGGLESGHTSEKNVTLDAVNLNH